MKIKRQVALSVISALLISLLPVGNPTVSKAGQDPTSAEQSPTSAEPGSTSAAGGTAGAGYGLNNPTMDRDGVVTWDCVWFGNYWQKDTNGDGKANKKDAKQPIKWRVLSVDGDDAFLLADKCLDCQRYNDNDTDIEVTWETCTIRSWLNGYGAASNQEGKDYSSGSFFDYAFTSAEQSAIRTTNVVNGDNPFSEKEGGNDTLDKVYLLSLDEVMNPAYGFTSKGNDTKTRIGVNTVYIADKGGIDLNSFANVNWWWLRSPGDYNDFAAGVDYDGDVDDGGNYVSKGGKAVRPVLHLNLSSDSSWSYAGKVISEGGEVKLVKIASIKLKQKKRTVTVSWKKVRGATGYQMWYSTSKKWKGTKQRWFRKNKVTVKNLKKKTYYFRVRAYRARLEENEYGPWSKTKKIKMTK